MNNNNQEFYIDREEGYFIAPSPLGRNMNLSLQAKGLMYVFFTLPPEWDYSFNGLVKICKEGKCAVRNTINELKEAGYIEISKSRNDKGQYQYKYIVHRKPVLEREKMGNYPTPDFRTTDYPASVNQHQLNNNNKIDIKDKYDKTGEPDISHHTLTKELFKLNFIKEDDSSSFYFDELFNDYINNGYSYRELLGAIHYIVPRVISRDFIDEEGNEIKNKYGYFKNAIESNFNKLNNLGKELYPDDPNDKFWDDFEL